MTKHNSIKRTDRIITKITTIIASSAGIFLLIWGIRTWINFSKYEETEDAQLEAYINPVTARVSGFVKEIHYQENQHVKKGDTLLVIDSREYVLSDLQSTAVLQNSREQIAVLKSNIRTAEDLATVNKAKISGVKSKLVKQKLEFERFKKLFEAESVTSQQMEGVNSELEVADSEYHVALSNYAAAQSKVDEYRSQLIPLFSEIKKHELISERSSLDVSYTIITAPYDGRIGKRLIQIGQQIQIGQALAFIVDEHSGIWVVANFKETQINTMYIGQDVEIYTDALPGKKIRGTIESLSPATGARYSLLPPDNSTGNFVKIAQRIPVKIKIFKTAKEFGLLSPGMNASVKVLKSNVL